MAPVEKWQWCFQRSPNWQACSHPQNLRIRQILKTRRAGGLAEAISFRSGVGPGRGCHYVLGTRFRSGLVALKPKCKVNGKAPLLFLQPLKPVLVSVTSDGENLVCECRHQEDWLVYGGLQSEPFPLLVVRGWTWARFKKCLQNYAKVPAIELVFRGQPVVNCCKIGSSVI